MDGSDCSEASIRSAIEGDASRGSAAVRKKANVKGKETEERGFHYHVANDQQLHDVHGGDREGRRRLVTLAREGGGLELWPGVNRREGVRARAASTSVVGRSAASNVPAIG